MPGKRYRKDISEYMFAKRPMNVNWVLSNKVSSRRSCFLFYILIFTFHVDSRLETCLFDILIFLESLVIDSVDKFTSPMLTHGFHLLKYRWEKIQKSRNLILQVKKLPDRGTQDPTNLFLKGPVSLEV